MKRPFNPPKRNYIKQQVLKDMKHLDGEVPYKAHPGVALEMYLARLDMDEINRQGVAVRDILENEAISDQEREVLEARSKWLNVRWEECGARLHEACAKERAVLFGCALRPPVVDRWLCRDDNTTEAETAFTDVWKKISSIDA